MVSRWTPRRIDPIHNSLSILAADRGSRACGIQECSDFNAELFQGHDMRALTTIVALLIASTAAAQSTPALKSPPREALSDTARLGTYDLEVTTDDGTLIGVLTVRRDANGLTGDLTVGGNKPAIKSFLRDGDHYVLTGGHGTFTVVYTLKFSRDSLGGSFTMSSGLAGKVLGAIRK
jgi:hypothetical protein